MAENSSRLDEGLKHMTIRSRTTCVFQIRALTKMAVHETSEGKRDGVHCGYVL